MSSIPQKIGEFKIVRPLGAGIMGDVYLGEIRVGREEEYHAIKVLNPDHAIRRGSSAKFINEITSPYLMHYIKIEPVSIGSTQFFLAMDYLEVKPVGRKSLKTTLSSELLEMFANVAEACAIAHEKKILHKNIKPSNFLIRRAGPDKLQPILTDWGLDYVYSPDFFVGEVFENTVTYMAPETIAAFTDPDDEGKQTALTPAADIYSLTLVLLETLIRKPLFRGAGSVEELLKLKSERKFMLLNVNYPKKNVIIKELNELVRKNLESDPAKRSQDMKTFAGELRAAIAKEAAAV